jgi:hypothetical protein
MKSLCGGLERRNCGNNPYVLKVMEGNRRAGIEGFRYYNRRLFKNKQQPSLLLPPFRNKKDAADSGRSTWNRFRSLI